MAQNIVVISAEDDAHIEFVQRHLARPMVLIDSVAIVKDKAPLTYRWSSKSQNFAVEQSGRLLKANSVWYRKPEPITTTATSLGEGYADYAASASQMFNWLLRGQFSDSFWVSNFFAMYQAENKLLQLSKAAKIGFKTPDTVCTSSKKAAQDFINRYDTIIFKPIRMMFFFKDGLYRGLFAQKLHKETAKFNNLNLAPAIFQQLIEPEFDIRATVVGNKVFAASIHHSKVDNPKSTIRDWRVIEGSNDVYFSEFKLPKNVEKLCIEHVKELGLVYGALDLILDRKGVFWFLENNPGGQWAFVEESTGQPIGKAIADLLARPPIGNV